MKNFFILNPPFWCNIDGLAKCCYLKFFDTPDVEKSGEIAGTGTIR